MRRTIPVIFIAIAGLLAACTVNPATGRRSFTLLTWDEEKQLGAEAAPQFTEQFGGEIVNAEINAYIDGVGTHLAEMVEAGVPALEWEFTLLDSDVINAFALPGGKIFITRGLATKLENEAQIAGVLGHEIGHVTARHGNQRISKDLVFNAGLAAGAIAVGMADEDSDFRKYGEVAVPALAIGGNVVLLKYGRDQELEADALGMRYMTRCRYDPRGQLQVMQILAREAGTGRQLEFFSTHPHPESRIDRIRDLLAGEYAHTQGNPEYKLYEDRYRQQFLSQLGAAESADGPGDFVLVLPSTWCAHCGAEQ